MRLFWILLGVLVLQPVQAHPRSVQECAEGRDFIVHATQSRDAGVDGPTFLDHFEDDLKVALGLPPSMRWFVQDQDDIDLLRAGAHAVFELGLSADENGTAFMQACTTTGRVPGPATPAPPAAPSTWL